MSFFGGAQCPPPLWSGGPAPGAFYPFATPTTGGVHDAQASVTAAYQHMDGQTASTPAPSDPRQHTMRPIVTGTSVLGLSFDGGVIMSADTLASYGSLARYKNVSRMCKVGSKCVVAASGDIADYHFVRDLLEKLEVENQEAADGHELTPRAVHTYLTRVLYNRRTKMNPLWTTVVVGGLQDGKPYLGVCDQVGTAFTDKAVATRYAAHIALPGLRNLVDAGDVSRADAETAIKKAMTVLFYRDCRALNKYQTATITADGITISDPVEAESDWSIANMVNGYE
eukprot:m.354034 g.354034  ORF g.354034 m.354034 type:complete len:283 (+) comp16901_c0_seq1:93-941(+)